MDRRRLGRTNLRASQVGFGGTWIAELPPPQAREVVRHGYELGINYFDTARWDGDSEEKIGEALKDTRNQCIIATKTGNRTKPESLQDLRVSLKNLQTDYIDILQLHGIDDEKTLNNAMSEKGVLQTCKQAQREGLVKFIGITGHKPRVLTKAVATGEFDTVLVPLNVVTPQALEELLPTAKAHDVGVVVMKSLSVKTSNLITCLYQPSLSLVSQEAELKTLLGQSAEEQVSSALHYVLAQDVAVVIAGLKSLTEVETAVNAGNQYSRLTPKTQRQFSFKLGNYCRDCGLCMPCPYGINIPAVLRFQMLHDVYGLKNWAKKLYRGLEVRADKCENCGQCTPKCPYNISIESKLENAKQTLTE
ncbi:aldo/keto reductase [Candidatus Bathycorpusculum sp.]|uniref:aldo/keto reductase n=1 Tax=Candidatus Bathycorpusculum sp. TaxID=2994959 RepID=UPI002827E7D1|nr:aldo/keto reductase [Candidatus Termitimicrobium sp.]MCL2432356.1 aldo/keto reductase [Candidatus Termitimicrobium sp.]